MPYPSYMRKKIDLTGQRFGRLVALHQDIREKPGRAYWVCLCDCGKETTVRGGNLRSGDTRSCGCLSREVAQQRATTHGLSKHPLFKVWCNMRQRCSNPRTANWAPYGGRGIVVCDRWKESFQAFYEDMSPTYQVGLQLDRIDNDGPYTSENCRWATRDQQGNNRRPNRRLAFDGQIHTVTEWADLLDIDRQALYARLSRGWSVERVLTEPSHSEKSPK